MPQITVADLIATGVAVSASEAIALTLAVAEVLAQRELSELPPDAQILLSSTGQVSFGDVDASTAEDIQSPTSADVTAQLAALLRRILQFDEPASGDRRRRVPSAVLVLLARSTHHVDLPPLELSVFRDGLLRYATPDAAVLAGIFWRAARVRPPYVRRQTVPSLPTVAATHDRRRHSPPSSELRRYLRDMERELYESRTHDVAQAPPVPVTSNVERPAAKRNVWRVSSGVAATILGAVLGTFTAFILSGSFDFTATHVSQVATPAVNSTPPDHTDQPIRASGSGRAARPESTIRTTRTVQPLLLAASVGNDLFSPSFSPRGQTLLFHAGRKASPLMRASVTDTGEVGRIEKLLDDGWANYHVTMSPDGQLIAYDSDRDGVRGVYVAHADGSNPTRISGSGYASVPTWSPEGGRLAFVREEPGHSQVWNVWIADVDSGRLQRVTDHEEGQPWGASWFPEGRRLAYSVGDRVMVADLESGMARGYRSPRAGRRVRTPAVSPDGRRIVFQVEGDGVWLLDLERARMRRILKDATAEEFVWSPEGDAIAYHARSGGSYGLWKLALNGGAN